MTLSQQLQTKSDKADRKKAYAQVNVECQSRYDMMCYEAW